MRLAVGRVEAGVEPPGGVDTVVCRGLGSAVASRRGLAALRPLLDRAAVVHLHNVVNPAAIALAVATGRAVATVQDHRVSCPGPGRTQPTGEACEAEASPETCATCLPDTAYRTRTVALTRARSAALVGARLIVLSHWMARELARVGLDGARVIPPPVRAAARPAEGGRGFVVAGRLVSHKGVQEAWRAWDLAGRPEELLLVGEGRAGEELAGATPLGWLSRADFRAQLRRARALVLTPRWQEPFGIAGLEALAEGTPVVGWRRGGMADWAGPGCLEVAPGDVDGLAACLRRLVAEPRLGAEVGRAGWERVRARPGGAELGAWVEEVYRGVV